MVLSPLPQKSLGCSEKLWVSKTFWLFDSIRSNWGEGGGNHLRRRSFPPPSPGEVGKCFRSLLPHPLPSLARAFRRETAIYPNYTTKPHPCQPQLYAKTQRQILKKLLHFEGKYAIIICVCASIHLLHGWSAATALHEHPGFKEAKYHGFD